jgi:hypothetical protein
MKKISLIVIVLLLISAAFIFIHTRKKDTDNTGVLGNAPIGSWSGDSGETLVFLKDGTFSLKIPPPQKKTVNFVSESHGTYTMIDSTHIKLHGKTAREAVATSTVYQFSDFGGELSLQEPGSSLVQKYHHAIN